jgi:alpha-glucoside transport system permease protein
MTGGMTGAGGARDIRTAYLAMLGGPVGAHRWYLGHRFACAAYVVALALFVGSFLLFRERVEAGFGQLWLVALALFIGQLLLDAMAIPRWVALANRSGEQRYTEEDIPWPPLVIAVIAMFAFVLVVPPLLGVLGGVLGQAFGSARIGAQGALVVLVLIGVPTVLVGYIVLTEQALRHFPPRFQTGMRPWLWLFPALAFLFIFLVYPTILTFIRSLQDQSGTTFVGLANYEWFVGSEGALVALRNNMLWLVFFTLMTVGFGLAIAILLDRVRYESAAKTVIFVPMAISFVAAAVIWRFMYDWSIPGTPQTGTVNALLVTLGSPVDMQPIDWVRDQRNMLGLLPLPDLIPGIERLTQVALNNISLIFVGAWMWTGFCMVILSAGLKGISTELLEAARVDGANEWQVFRRIILPLLMPTIAVVSTTMIIFALKTFDIPYAMTAGTLDTQVVALEMWNQFRFNQYGRASAVAVVLLAAIVPVMLINIRRFREQEAMR